MKTTHHWLREYCPHSLSPREVAERLTMAGLAVEEMRPVGDDWLFTIEVTSNRPDLLGTIGIARELSALTGTPLQLPSITLGEGDRRASNMVKVTVEDTALCPRYTARLISNVQVTPSPPWLAARLTVLGFRPVNNVVDVTNYVLLESGQPLHAFDYDRLAGGEIVVRRARPGESITTIDGRLRQLTPEMLVIADARRPVAVAGVMGGRETEVGAETRSVLLESAEFKGASVRRTSRALGVATDASYRFERGVNPVGVEWASRRAAALIAELAGGEVAGGLVDVWAAPPAPRRVRLRFSRLQRVLGVEIPPDEVRRILCGLEFAIEGESGGELLVAVPAFRADVSREIDLIEEVARIHGYERIPETTGITVAVGSVAKVERVCETIVRQMCAFGFHETVSHSFTTEALANLVSPWADQPPMRIRNPIRQDEALLRRSIMPDLLAHKAFNADRGEVCAELFELGAVYLPRPGEKLPREQRCLAILEEDGLLNLKGVVEALLATLSVLSSCRFEPLSDPFFRAGAAAWVNLGGERLGVLGEVAPAVAVRFGFRSAPCLAEINVDLLVAHADLNIRVRPLPIFPAVLRDLAVVVREDTTWAQVEECVRAAAGEHLSDLRFFDLYRGPQVPPGCKSLAFRLSFRAADRTLTNEEIDRAIAAVVAALQRQLQASLRGPETGVPSRDGDKA